LLDVSPTTAASLGDTSSLDLVQHSLLGRTKIRNLFIVVISSRSLLLAGTLAGSSLLGWGANGTVTCVAAVTTLICTCNGCKTVSRCFIEVKWLVVTERKLGNVRKCRCGGPRLFSQVVPACISRASFLSGRNRCSNADALVPSFKQREIAIKSANLSQTCDCDWAVLCVWHVWKQI